MDREKTTINSDDEEYLYISHGGGSPLDEYYPVLPEIPKTNSVLRNGQHRKFTPSPVLKLKPDCLPGIKAGKRDDPCPPSTPKLKKTRPFPRKKSLSELTERDLDPANKYSVLPQVRDNDTILCACEL